MVPDIRHLHDVVEYLASLERLKNDVRRASVEAEHDAVAVLGRCPVAAGAS
jgi:hypothetical protein